ncbi:MAG TPA: Gfo/Idh/MocA family oxidoreductase [Microlunatus sp.]|nr:Gfo/Idh/MocA family oxidoreductase [Microlunatus sp.]
MKIGLIGLGRIGTYHATNLVALDEVEELVVTDPVPAAVMSAVERYGATPAASVESLIAAVDAVMITAPTSLHLGLIQRSVAAGRPTFCEKPVAENPDAAGKLLSWIESSGVPVQIGFPRRFDPAFVAAKAALESGELGFLTTVRSTTMDPAPPPMAYLAGSGGIFRDCAIHDLDAVRWVTGREVVEVYATGANKGDPEFTSIGDVDTASALLTFDDGTLGVISNTRYNGAGYDVRLELHGSDGSIAAGLDDGLPLVSAEPSVTFPAGPAHTFFMDRLAEAFRIEIAAFVEVAAGRAPSPCTMADGLESSWIAEACARSLAEHRPVRVSEVR